MICYVLITLNKLPEFISNCWTIRMWNKDDIKAYYIAYYQLLKIVHIKRNSLIKFSIFINNIIFISNIERKNYLIKLIKIKIRKNIWTCLNFPLFQNSDVCLSWRCHIGWPLICRGSYSEIVSKRWGCVVVQLILNSYTTC